jgi:hypothetical protein
MSYMVMATVLGRTDDVDTVRSPVANYDQRVLNFGASVVSYWKCNDAGSTLVDLIGTQNGTITGTPERDVPTIVDDDAGGTCLAWPGTVGEYASVAHNAAHKTAAGSIVLTVQRDLAVDKSILVAGDAANAAGGFSIEINADGSIRAYLRNASAVVIGPLNGAAGVVQLEQAYTLVFKWGTGGLSLSIWDDTGAMLERLTNAATDGMTASTSALRFGAWHTDVGHFDGPFGRVIWLNRRISDLEEGELARARNIVHDIGTEPPPGVELPFFGQYYGSGPWSAPNPGNITMTTGGAAGLSFFFYADRTGVIDRVAMHYRNYTGGYAAGTGGTYSVSIWPANAGTKLPITTGFPICNVDGVQPGVNTTVTDSKNNIISTFTTQGAVTAKQPYCLVFRNRDASPGANYVSCNVGVVVAWSSEAAYQEPAGTNPASVGASITSVSGWYPVVIDGTTRWYPWSCVAKNNVIDFDNRSGPLYAAYRYTDGQWCGWGGVASQTGGHAIISGNSMVRDRFRVSRADRTVSGVFIRVTRKNAATGSLIVTLESGPASDTSGNGTALTSVTVAASNLYDVGASEVFNGQSQGDANVDLVPFLWVPFSPNITLTRGTIYNLRLSKSGGSNDFDIWMSQRLCEWFPLGGPAPTTSTWDQWEAGRQVELSGNEDSRGAMVSSNGGSSWAYNISTGRLMPYIFKCV